MKNMLMNDILNGMMGVLNQDQLKHLKTTLQICLTRYDIEQKSTDLILYDDSNMRYWERYKLDKSLSGLSDASLKNYETTIVSFLSVINKPINEYNSDDVFIYLEQYKTARQVSLSRIKNMRSALSSFFTWLCRKGYAKHNPVDQLDPIKLPKLIKKGFTDEERELLKINCKHDRDAALIEFLYSTGVRVSEVTRLNISDVNFDTKELIVFGKGSKEHVTYMNPTSVYWLKKYLSTRNDDNPALFVSLNAPHQRLTKKGIEDMLKRLGAKAGVENVHPHRFRRTCATNALNRGMPLEQVSQLLGHEKLDTTKIYCSVNQEIVKMSHSKYLAA